MTKANDIKKTVTTSIESFEDILNDLQNNWYLEYSEVQTVKIKLEDAVIILRSLRLYLEKLIEYLSQDDGQVQGGVRYDDIEGH